MSDSKRGLRLLAVDWDYFFPVLEHPSQEGWKDYWQMYDWGHSEAHSNGLQTILWGNRASEFDRVKLPLPQVSGWGNFWERFEFSRGAPLFLADSNRFAALVPQKMGYGVRNFREVWNFDAHHDCGYIGTEIHAVTLALQQIQRGRVSCEDWMAWYGVNDVDLVQRYPKWRSYAMKIEPTPLLPQMSRSVDSHPNRPVRGKFDAVFICRSGSWVPPWCDAEFDNFVVNCPAHSARDQVLQPIESREGWEQIRAAQNEAIARMIAEGMKL